MKVVFDDKTEFIAEEVFEKFQFMQYYIYVRVLVTNDYDFTAAGTRFFQDHINGFVEKVDIYDDDDTLINSIEQVYQVEYFNKVYKEGPSTSLIIELRQRSDITSNFINNLRNEIIE